MYTYELTDSRQHDRALEREQARQWTIAMNQARHFKLFTVPLQLNGEPLTDFDDGLYCPIDFGLN